MAGECYGKIIWGLWLQCDCYHYHTEFALPAARGSSDPVMPYDRTSGRAVYKYEYEYEDLMS
jgi:hypothetical protein